MSSSVIPLVPPTFGTNWSCALEFRLKLLVIKSRDTARYLLWYANTVSWLGFLVIMTSLVLVSLNTVYPYGVIRIFLVFLTVLALTVDFRDMSINAYDTAFELQELTDTIEAELFLATKERVDGVYFFQAINADRVNTLHDFYMSTDMA